jgi:sterol desaturase/sphingolipid hydroxylase (fatty acid hydroxylase superfamily)
MSKVNTLLTRLTSKRLLVLTGWASLTLFCALATAQALGDAVPESMLERIYGPYAPVMRQIAQVLLHLGIVIAVALPFQAFLPGIRRKTKVLTYEYWLDVMYSCQGVWLSFLALFVFADTIQRALFGDSMYWIPGLRELPAWVQVTIAVWAFDFAVYWRHRLEHTWPVLWAFHAVHHTAEKVDVLTTSRLHFGELLLGSIINNAVMRAGLAPEWSVLGFAIYLNYNYFIHTNVRIRLSGYMKYIFVTPFMHQWHHATDKAASGKNVGVVFAWNDWIFGTAYHPDHWPTTFGLNASAAESAPQSYFRHVLYPVQYLIARRSAWRASRAPLGHGNT